jgi:hypothetical protein
MKVQKGLGWLIVTIGWILAINLIWIAFIHTPAKIEVDRPHFVLVNSILSFLFAGLGFTIIRKK